MIENLRRHYEFVRTVTSDKGVQTVPHRLRRTDHGAGEKSAEEWLDTRMAERGINNEL